MRRVVVLPAPFGPSRPKISPAATVRSIPLTAATVWPATRKDLRSPLIATATALRPGSGSMVVRTCRYSVRVVR